MPVACVLVAAGPGSRLGADRPKALVELGGRPLLAHAIDAIERARDAVRIDRLVIVAPPSHQAQMEAIVAARGEVVAGGAERQDSVRAGLDRCRDCGIIAVHDAARPFLSGEVLGAVVAAANSVGAAVSALPAVDTVKIVDDDRIVSSTPPRDRVWLAQTPQAFRRDVLVAAHASAADNASTDDASLVELAGGKVQVVEGHPAARKITTQDDLRWAEWMLRSGQWPR